MLATTVFASPPEPGLKTASTLTSGVKEATTERAPRARVVVYEAAPATTGTVAFRTPSTRKATVPATSRVTPVARGWTLAVSLTGTLDSQVRRSEVTTTSTPDLPTTWRNGAADASAKLPPLPE